MKSPVFKRTVVSFLTLFGLLGIFNSPSQASLDSSEDDEQVSALVKLDSEDRLVPHDTDGVKLELPEEQPLPKSRTQNRLSIDDDIDPNSLNRLGCWHCNAQQFKEAKKYFRRASEQGNMDATFNLGRLYKHGFVDGVKDLKKAKMYYKKAADLGHPEAQNDLGVLYLEEGHGILPDLNEAEKYFNFAAAQGLTKAVYNLGCVYYEMNKLEMAITYFEQAVLHGTKDTVVDAQHNLGVAREKRREVNQETKTRNRSGGSLPDLRFLEQMKKQGSDEKQISLQDKKKPQRPKGALKDKSPSPPPSPKNGVIWTHLFSSSKRGSQESPLGSPHKSSPRNKSLQKEPSRVVQPHHQDTSCSPPKRAGSDSDLR